MDNSYKAWLHHTQFCFVLAKQFVFVNRKPVQVKTIFSPTKIFSIVTELERFRREYLNAYNFLSGDKSPLLRDSFPSSGHQYFANMTNYRIRVPHRLLLTFLVIPKISLHEQGCKNKRLVIKKFCTDAKL